MKKHGQGRGAGGTFTYNNNSRSENKGSYSHSNNRGNRKKSNDSNYRDEWSKSPNTAGNHKPKNKLDGIHCNMMAKHS